MATVEEVARETVASLDTDAGYLLCSRWVASRYRQLCSRSRFRHLRRIGEVILPGAIDTGTVTATRGSRTITGNAAAQAVWTPSIVGRFFKAGVVWYRIGALVNSEIRLEKEYTETDASAVAYKIVQRYVPLRPDVRWLGQHFVHYRLRRPLDRKSLAEMDYLAPERQLVGTPPVWWAEAPEGLDADNRKVKTVEFYPIDNNDELLYYVYWTEPPILGLNDEIPAVIDSHVLREGALIDLMRYEMSRKLNKGMMEIAAVWGNHFRAQSTAWEKNIIEAIRTDRGTDDISFILESVTGARSAGDITNARDEIFARGARP